ncbi:SpoIIE family protein phosphatase [Streptomyces sp. NBC_01142]|uniref:SpoIIE family protein phosphatase n=1 Tax=Streptomyces sp. NBC_01142 TaxID=2975865 RepID=UPI002B1E000C|nr:SpoIIE family protein phosphatase [Streptomyces sp. NBC_01142]
MRAGQRVSSIPRASAAYTPGYTLLLYSDGMIGHCGEDIGVGLARLTDALAQCSRLATKRLADAVLARLGVGGGAHDDIALVIVSL